MPKKQSGILWLLVLLPMLLAANKDSLLRVIRNPPNSEALLEAYPSLAFALHLSKPDSSILMARKGIRLADSLGNRFHRGSSLNMCGLAYYRKGWYATALSTFRESEKVFLSLREEGQAARVYQNMAHVYQARKDYRQAQVYNLKALRFYEKEKDSLHIASCYQTLGIVLRELNEYEQSASYLDASIRILGQLGQIDELANAHSIKGNLWSAMKRYDAALVEMNIALPLYDKAGDLANKAITLENMASVYEGKGNFRLAVDHYNQAIALFSEVGSEVDVAFERMLRSGALLRLNRNEEALNDLDMAETVFRREKVVDYLADLYDKRSEWLEQNNRHAEALQVFKRHIALKDSLATQRQTDEMVRLQAEFDFERKEKEIALLKAEALAGSARLQKRNGIIALLLLLGAVSVALILFYRKRKKLQDELRKQQMLNQIAADLHDDVGASLSAIRMYGEVIRKKASVSAPDVVPIAGKISDNARELIQSMSDIVWTIKPGQEELKSLEDRLHNLGLEFCSPAEIRFVFKGSGYAGSFVLPIELRNDLYLICKEALHNALKHARASVIQMQFDYKNGWLSVEITDNGLGFTHERALGNGLKNMQQRSLRHHGSFELRQASPQGTTAQVKLPCSPR